MNEDEPTLTGVDSGVPNAPAATQRAVQEGDVLNHLYEVKRFIARGGMGEVFEGVNINQPDERVAIKVILPHLAANPDILALFRREARTLIRLGHPALVQYRTLAQEPQLGVFYIVTEYIDGVNLSDVLTTIKATPAEVRALVRRLAEGLAVAHRLEAIHRDLSPDNIMLEGGRLDGAKVIDFGIAKDIGADSKTIIGDNFAGKLAYVAPEQLGDFGREVGPWTDVYGLGLIILSILRNADTDLGGSLVEAIDKRRAGIDLAGVPEDLKPLLDGMLKPDPAQRLRSMEAVIAVLDTPGPAATPATAAEQTMLQTTQLAFPADDATVFIPAASDATVFIADPLPGLQPANAPVPAEPERQNPETVLRLAAEDAAAEAAAASNAAAAAAAGKNRMVVFAGIGAAVLAVAAAGAMFALREPVDPAKLAPAARLALAGGLGQVGCSWLDVTDVKPEDGKLRARFRGVTGNTEEAKVAIAAILEKEGAVEPVVDFAEVAPFDPSGCATLDVLRAIRADGPNHIQTDRRSYTMGVLSEGVDAGKAGAGVAVDISLDGLAGEVALVGLEDNGRIAQFASTRAEILAAKGGDPNGQINADVTHKGWSGIVLLSGQGPFDMGLPQQIPAAAPAGWAEKFAEQARARGWKAEMVWFKLS